MANKAIRTLSAIFVCLSILFSNLTVKATENDTELAVNNALSCKTFYHFNQAYAKIILMPETEEKYKLLDKLMTIHDTVWTDEINTSLSMLTELTKTASARKYAEIESYVSKSKLNDWDKGYLLGELTSWGLKLVWTEDYAKALDALNNSYLKKDSSSIVAAEKYISQVKNQYNKDYLLEELNKLKLSIGYKEDPLLMPIEFNGVKLNNSVKLAENFTVKTAINMDLLFISAVVGGNFNHPPQYITENDKYGININIKDYFGKYVNNNNAKKINEYALKINNPPKKFINPILSEILAYDNGSLIKRSDETIQIWDNLKQFSKDTNAIEFFKANKNLYDDMITEFTSKTLNFNPLDRLSKFLGISENNNKYVIVLSTAMGGGQATLDKNADGSTTYYSIINPSTNANETLNTLYHEIAHNFYDVRIDDKELIQKYSKYADALGKHEADFGTELNETIARVVTAVIIDTYHGKEAAEYNLNLVNRSNWKNVRELYTLVKDSYLPNREKYKTFKDFMPVICEYLKAYSLGQSFQIQ
jgi:hypothetical protein